MAKVGRPSKLTPLVKERLLTAIASGSFYEPACAYAGIDYATFRNWMQRGEGTHPTRSQAPEYVEFVEAVKKAETQAELADLQTILNASKENWTAAAWRLERRFPERWANTQKIRIQVEKQLETQFDSLFEAIASDPSIDTATKRKILEHASNLQSRAEMAGRN